MTDGFEKAERSCFNLTHYAKLIPESHCIFIMPPGCSRILRLSSIEEGVSQQFSMFNLEPSDVINGNIEKIQNKILTDILQNNLFFKTV